MLRVLVVGEDEALKHSLNGYGYNVFSIQKTITELEYVLREYALDVVLITIDAKKSEEGFAIGHFLHQFGSIPFIYLSNHANDSLLRKAKITHPHGYHVKPFDPVNLHTSIECAFHCFKKSEIHNTTMQQLRSEYELLKKRAFNVQSNTSTIKLCDCYQFNLRNYSLLHQNNEIKITKKERSLLSLLIAERGSIVDFERIIDYVWANALRVEWGGEIPTHHDVRTLIWRLNKKLPAPLIQNASGIGYFIETQPL